MFPSLPEASPDSSSQPAPSCLTVMAPSPSKPRTAELVLQRMQQFKRADPERLLRASEGCCLQAALAENASAGPPEEMTAGNGMMGVLYIPVRDEFELCRKGAGKERVFLELLVGVSAVPGTVPWPLHCV